MLNRPIRTLIAIALILVFAVTTTSADEGMWLFDDLPTGHLQQRYGFEPTQEWIDHIRLSCVRFNSGGSASFVSSDGLVLTNHHVASDTLYKLSTAEHNYNQDGFLARTHEQELQAPDLEINQLVAIEDVTDRVNAAVQSEMSPDEAHRARRAIMAEIEQQSLDQTGFRSDVVTLYGGGRYHLYRYKKYTDVRLVWAPESEIAFFGGDADNFEYPRYCLDVTLMRAYEDGQPARVDHFLSMAAGSGIKDGELVFVAGNPGRTQRILTVAALEYQRDDRVPYVLDFLRRREVLFQQFALEGDEQKRRVQDDLFGIQNSRKSYQGEIQGLQDPKFMKDKRLRETQLMAAIAADGERAETLEAWNTIEQVHRQRSQQLGQNAEFAGQYYRIANQLVHMAEEDLKPSAERLREYRDSNRESLEQQLFSPAPIYDDLERLKLADSMALFVERRGGDHPLVSEALRGQSPRERAAELVQATQLRDVELRKALSSGGKEAIDACDDPMIELAQAMSSDYRRLREMSDEGEELERQAYAEITRAKFDVEGTDTYPDATFTLRLAFGTVSGYHVDSDWVAPWTTIGGAFDYETARGGRDSWVLPASWKEHQGAMDSTLPLNFVCTADIIGGNSGSPVVNRRGELVGIIFDGNIQSLTADYMYSDESARAVSVAAAAVREALRVVYDADSLAEEMGR